MPSAAALSERRWYLLGALLIAAVLLLRISWYPIITNDYVYFLKPWFDTLASNPGLSAFSQSFANYAPLYLYFLKVLTFLTDSSLYGVKTLSLAFDILIAAAVFLILRASPQFRERPGLRFLAAVVFFALPTVMVNSSLWGQSDAIYGAGILFSLWFILRGKPFFAALAFGLALSMKVQAIFFAPILMGYLLRRRETWKFLFVPPLVFAATVLPAVFGGGAPGYWFLIYSKQAGEYPYLSVSAQSIFAFAQPLALSAQASSVLFWLGIGVAGFVALAATYVIFKTERLSVSSLILITAITTLLLPYLLPRMHERYFYLADLFVVLYAWFAPNRAFAAMLVVFASFISYFPYLSSHVPLFSGLHVDLRIPATLLLIPIGYLLADAFWKRSVTQAEASESPSLRASRHSTRPSTFPRTRA